MPSTSPVRRDSSHPPAEERGAKGSGLRRLGALFGGPLANRPRPSPNEPATALDLLRGELRGRLLAHQNSNTALVMRHLVFVQDELGQCGWAGVAAFPVCLLRKALTQADILGSEERSPALADALDKLRACLVAAELREERATRPQTAGVDMSVVVSEVSHEDFAQIERAWVETVSSTFTLQPMVA